MRKTAIISVIFLTLIGNAIQSAAQEVVASEVGGRPHRRVVVGVAQEGPDRDVAMAGDAPVQGFCD